jgi:hypothetical protein
MENVPAGAVVDDRMLALATSMQMVCRGSPWPSSLQADAFRAALLQG